MALLQNSVIPFTVQTALSEQIQSKKGRRLFWLCEWRRCCLQATIVVVFEVSFSVEFSTSKNFNSESVF